MSCLAGCAWSQKNFMLLYTLSLKNAIEYTKMPLEALSDGAVNQWQFKPFRVQKHGLFAKGGVELSVSVEKGLVLKGGFWYHIIIYEDTKCQDVGIKETAVWSAERK